MNELANTPRMLPTTQAAEGLPRLRWTVADLDRLIDAGVLGEDDRVELIGGELVPMAAKGNRHENLKIGLTDWMYRRLPDSLLLAVELGWRPNGETYLEPDILIFNRTSDPSSVPASQVLLAIEVAASSWAYDAGRKAEIYASLGVSDYWVINVATASTRIYRKPSPQGYLDVADIAHDGHLQPLLIPSLSVRIADLGLG